MLGAHDHDRDRLGLGIRAKTCDQLRAPHHRHHQVGHNKPWPRLHHVRERHGPVGRFHNLVAPTLEDPLEQKAHARLVVDDEDSDAAVAAHRESLSLAVYSSRFAGHYGNVHPSPRVAPPYAAASRQSVRACQRSIRLAGERRRNHTVTHQSASVTATMTPQITLTAGLMALGIDRSVQYRLTICSSQKSFAKRSAPYQNSARRTPQARRAATASQPQGRAATGGAR